MTVHGAKFIRNVADGPWRRSQNLVLCGIAIDHNIAARAVDPYTNRNLGVQRKRATFSSGSPGNTVDVRSHHKSIAKALYKIGGVALRSGGHAA